FPELVPTEPDHPNTAPMNRVRDALRDWRKPTLVIWGADDAVLPPHYAHGFVELIPGARGPVLIEGAAHFLQEDRPDELAEAMREFLADCGSHKGKALPTVNVRPCNSHLPSATSASARSFSPPPLR